LEPAGVEACHKWLPFSLAKSQVVPFFVVTWPPNLIISDLFKGISGPDSDEKLAPNIIDKYRWRHLQKTTCQTQHGKVMRETETALFINDVAS
jgi:hypothetical protein